MAAYPQDIAFNANIEPLLTAVDTLNLKTLEVSQSALQVGAFFQRAMSTVDHSVNAIDLASPLHDVAADAQGLTSAAAPANAFARSLQEASALADLTGLKLHALAAAARQNGADFGVAAAQGVDHYRAALSRLGLDIAYRSAALQTMGEQVTSTSQMMGGDAEQADTRMETPIQKHQRLKKQVDDLNISMYNATEGGLGYLEVFADIAEDVSLLTPLLTPLKSVLWKVASNTVTLAQKLGATLAPLLEPLGASLLKLADNTRIVAFAQKLWNLAFRQSPIGLIVVALGALTAGIIWAYKNVAWFRGVIKGAWESLKTFGTIITDHVISVFKKLVAGVSGIGKAFKHLFSGEWKEAWATGKEAVGELGGAALGMTPAGAGMAVYHNAKKIGDAARKGYAEGVAEAPPQESDAPAYGATTGPLTSMLATTGLAPSFSGGAAAENIVGEGRRQVTLNVNIERVIENLTQEIHDGVEAADELVEKVIEGLTSRIRGTARGILP